MAARVAFANYGFDGTSYRDVAELAEISHGGIYYYFPTKQDLFVEVHREVQALAIEQFKAAVADREGLLDRIDALMEVSARMHAEDRTLASFMAVSPVEIQRHPDLREALGAETLTIYRFLERVVANGASELPAGTDTRALIDMLVAVMSGFSQFGATTKSVDAHHNAIRAFQGLVRGSLVERT